MAVPANNVPDSTFSAAYAVTVVKSDSTVFNATRGVYVGGAGDVAVKMSGDNATVTFAGVQAGTILPIRATSVMSAGTTATLMPALY